MEHAFWHDRWQQGQIGFHLSQVQPLLQQFWPQLNADKSHTVFVPLCGKSLDMLWLQQQGHCVSGVELSPLAARDFFSENNISAQKVQLENFQRWFSEKIEILAGDFFQLKPGNFTLVYDRAALIALPKDMRQAYARHLTSLCAQRAKVLLITLDYDTQNGTIGGPPFSVAPEEVKSLFSEHWHINQLQRNEVLHQESKFQKKGAKWIYETVWLLERKD